MTLTSLTYAEVVVKQIEEKIIISNNYLKIEYDLNKGELCAKDFDDELVIKGAYSAVLFNKNKVATSLDDYQHKFIVNSINNKLGKCKEVKIFFNGNKDKPDIILLISLYEKSKFFTVSAGVKNSLTKTITINKLFPQVLTAKQNGGIFLGDDLKNTVVLENGNDVVFDFYVRLINIKQNSISDWNSAIYDLDSKKSFISGFLTNLSSLTKIIANYQENESVSYKNKKGISSYSAICEYDPPKSLSVGETLFSEKLYINFLEKNPHEGLENFAEIVGRYNEIRKWKGEIPTGWNSWASLSHDIDEDKMLKNAQFVADNLKSYGMAYFQIDDGWQIADGDWDANKNFHHGMKWILDKIRKMGLKPGLWIAPFVVSHKSSIYKYNKDWIVDKNPLARKIMPPDWEILDLSHPEVQKWLYKLFHKLGHEWGCKWIKTDFVYYSLLGKKYYNKNATGVEVYRMGLKIIRDALPKDCFLLNVGVPLGLSLGLVDGMRFALDNTSCWNDSDEPLSQGLKPMVRNLARRYYLNYNVWINHPDMFYLGSEEENNRWGCKLTLNEARCYASLVALTGGITKIGDTFINLSEEQLDLLRKLLPVYPHSARPLDLFTSRYPQIWNLKINKKFASWNVVGVFNWGKNVVDGKETGDIPVDITVNFEDLGLDKNKEYLVYEFWKQDYLGEYKDKVVLHIEPRDVKILTIHPKNFDNLPQFLSNNRHITQGATDILDIKTKKTNTKTHSFITLNGSLKGVKGFLYNLILYIPDKYILKNVKINVPEFNTHKDNKILKLSFTSDEDKIIKLELKFEEDRKSKRR